MTAPPRADNATAPRSISPSGLRGLHTSAIGLRRLTLTALIANIAIVVSGGLVRLTDSGLGCPSWPDCAGSSLTPTRQLSWHKYVEFGNRLFTYVVLIAVVAALIGVLRARPGRPDLRRWAWLTFLGVPAQAVMGGITVLTHLNPWAVAAHFVLSMLLVSAATLLWWKSRTAAAEGAGVGLHPLLRRLAWATLGVTYAVLAAGTVVTGSGPHAGDASAKRIGIRPETISQLHADLVMLLVGLALALAVAVTAVGAAPPVLTTTRVLVGLLAFQAAIGFAQYFDKLPIGLVELHMFGAAAITASATAIVAAIGRDRTRRQT
jgi:cytochrome c oxidase assembly protein subunit 15